MSDQYGVSEEDSGRDLPLSGITVADFSWVLAGPRATSWLAAMGARVIKIEGPRRPDQYRNVPIFVPGREGPEGSAAFHGLNHTKWSCAIDFNDPKGLELVKKIVAESDVVVENFARGVMERVGLNYAELCKIKPDIIMASGSAMGSSGPDKNHVAYGTLIHAFAGINSVTGYQDSPPGSLGGTFTDPLTGTSLVFLVLAALWNRRRTGTGENIDLSMVETSLMQLPEFVMDYTANGRVAGPQGNEDGTAAPHDCYPCIGEEAWVAISVRTQEEWEAFCTVLDRPELIHDPRFADELSRFQNRETLNTEVAVWTKTRTAIDVAETLQGVGVAAGPSYAARALYEDPHFGARGLFQEVDHPVVGRKPVVGLPWRLLPGPGSRYWAAPTLGQHTDVVMREIVGLSDEEIAVLRAEQVIA
ncbi:MAG: CoA transferase [Chloroflexi bacterium]|nr:CoA transferase [Chloroflexota bacterium]MDA1147437.1 CoA transferase [Chloroflexota bacterium]